MFRGYLVDMLLLISVSDSLKGIKWCGPGHFSGRWGAVGGADPAAALTAHRQLLVRTRHVYSSEAPAQANVCINRTSHASWSAARRKKGMLCCRVWLGAVALIGYIVLFNLLVVVAQMKLNRAHPKSFCIGALRKQ